MGWEGHVWKAEEGKVKGGNKTVSAVCTPFGFCFLLFYGRLKISK